MTALYSFVSYDKIKSIVALRMLELSLGLKDISFKFESKRYWYSFNQRSTSMVENGLKLPTVPRTVRLSLTIWDSRGDNVLWPLYHFHSYSADLTYLGSHI